MLCIMYMKHHMVLFLFFLIFPSRKCITVENVKKEPVPFILESGIINMYVDGCCINNGQKNARAGVGVWFNHNHPLNTFKPVYGNPTNINAELQAAILGLETSLENGIKEIMLHTDSMFVIKCMTKWIKTWKENGWITTEGTEVKNRKVIEKLQNTINKMKKIFWVHVRGHGLEIGNIEADALAQKGAELFKNSNIPEEYFKGTSTDFDDSKKESFEEIKKNEKTYFYKRSEVPNNNFTKTFY